MPLSIVAVPIGHPEDITLRAINTLKAAELIVVEELKVGRRLLRQLGIPLEPIALNEHNEAEESPALLAALQEGKEIALISDAGTPLFADPGLHLVQACHRAGYLVRPIPGASSLTAALSVAGIRLQQFLYAGFLPRSPEERQKSLKGLAPLHWPVVIYDTPYRLSQLLQDVALVFGPEQGIALCMALTQEGEEIYKGTVGNFLKRLEGEPIKKEFVLILEAKPKAVPKPAKPARSDQAPVRRKRRNPFPKSVTRLSKGSKSR